MSSAARRLCTIQSNDASMLAMMCAALMQSKPLSDPLAGEKILIMNLGMQNFLTQEIARHCGIASRCEFMQVWQLIWSIYKDLFPEAGSINFFSRAQLTWNILGLKPEWSRQSGFERMQEYISGDQDGDLAFELSAKIADTFDQYQMYRPDWIRAWDNFTAEDFAEFDELQDHGGRISAWLDQTVKGLKAGQAADVRAALKANLWQVRLWSMLRANLQLTDPLTMQPLPPAAAVLANADRAQIMQLMTQLLHHQDRDFKLPERIFIFGVSALPPQVLEFLQALAGHIQVYLMLFNPCAQYWGDISSDWRSTFSKFSRRLQGYGEGTKASGLPAGIKAYKPQPYRSRVEDFDAEGLRVEGHPLLLSWGWQGRDNLSQLFALDPMPEFIDVFSAPGKDTVLHALQQQILDLDAGSEIIEVKADDNSLAIHACHTKRREVEVLKDALLRAFAADPDLEPRDIVVMVPTINDYAADITAVFGIKEAAQGPFVPYVISDRTVQQQSPIAEAVLRLLNIGSRRVTARVVLDLLAVPAIGTHFAINAEDIGVLSQWLQADAVYWGLDDEDTAEQSDIPLPGNLSCGLDRMLRGTLSGSTDEGAFAEIEGSDALLLGKLWAFVEALKTLRQIFTPTLSNEPAEWSRLLHEHIVGRFFDDDQECQRQLQQISSVIEQVQTVAQNLKLRPKITLPVFQAILRNALGDERDYSPFLRGKVNFCSLVPMRSVPFKHVFILGLNDADFPRTERAPGFNLMQLRGMRRRGDRSRDRDDRFLFLEAMLSARDSLYLSYIGKSPIDENTLNPSAVISELIDYLGKSCVIEGKSGPEAAAARFILQEKLNAYDPDNYQAVQKTGRMPRFPSFDAGNFQPRSAEPNLSAPQYIGLTLPAAVKLPEEIVIEPENLLSFFRSPCRYFLHQVHKLASIKLQNRMLADDEPFALSIYEQGRILKLLFNSDPKLWDEILKNNAKAGLLPSGLFELNAVHKLKQQAVLMQAALAEQQIQISALEFKEIEPICVSLRLEGNQTPYSVMIRGSLPQPLVIPCFYSKLRNNKKLKGKFWLAAGIQALVAEAAGLNSRQYLVDAEGDLQKLKPLSQMPGFDVKTCLNRVLTLFLQGLSEPLPWSDNFIDKVKLENPADDLADVLDYDADFSFVFGPQPFTASGADDYLTAERIKQTKDLYKFFTANFADRMGD